MWTNLEALPGTKYFFHLYGCNVSKCVHQARVAGGVGFLRAACIVNVQHRDETLCRTHQEITATIH